MHVTAITCVSKMATTKRVVKVKDFTVSNGWLHRFQIRHNIKTSVLSGESAEVKEEVVQEWARRLKDKCEGYALKDIFNADETGHFFARCP